MNKEVMKKHADKDGENSIFTLNVKNLHIHLDERSYINSSYNGAADADKNGDEADDKMIEKNGGCADGCDCCDEEFSKDFDTAEVIKEVSTETGFPEEVVKKVLNKQAELLMKRLFDED